MDGVDGAAMTLRRTNLLLLIALFALAIRAIVPAGFMPGNHDGRLTLDVCTSQGAMKIELGQPGKVAKVDAPCAFSGLTAPLLPGTPFALLALAIAFIVAAGFARIPFSVSHTLRRLRPPLRAPPVA